MSKIIIHGAGIAGLWLFRTLKKAGYDVILIEKNRIGGVQTIASQGILHSGVKYALAGKVNALAKEISRMPERWHEAMSENEDSAVNLSGAHILSDKQYLLLPAGFVGGILGAITKKTLDGVSPLPREEWPDSISKSGFNGSVITMNETVLDVPSVITALANPYQDCIYSTDNAPTLENAYHIYTAASGNETAAIENNHNKGLKTQARPLLMGMLKPAPFPLYAHLVGRSEKPVASITTHTDKNGELIWYIGGAVAERPKDSPPLDLYNDIKSALLKYMPDLDLQNVEWAALPIDRIEAATKRAGFMPDTPTVHEAPNALYCYPTKLTFAPLLTDMVIEHLEKNNINPNEAATHTTPPNRAPEYALPPWDTAQWTKID